MRTKEEAKEYFRVYYQKNKERLDQRGKRPCKICGKLCWGSKCKECYSKNPTRNVARKRYGS